MTTPEGRTEAQSGPKARTLGRAELRQVCHLMPQGSSAPVPLYPLAPQIMQTPLSHAVPLSHPVLIVPPRPPLSSCPQCGTPSPSANHTVFQDPRAAGFLSHLSFNGAEVSSCNTSSERISPT